MLRASRCQDASPGRFCLVTAEWIRNSVSLRNTAHSLSSIGLQYNPALTRSSRETLLNPVFNSSVARPLPEFSSRATEPAADSPTRVDGAHGADFSTPPPPAAQVSFCAAQRVMGTQAQPRPKTELDLSRLRACERPHASCTILKLSQRHSPFCFQSDQPLSGFTTTRRKGV